MDKSRKKGQNQYTCTISGCNQTGRTLAHLGDIKICYCHDHRKYGERILNWLVDSVHRGQLKDYLQDSKHELFMKNEPELCEDCYKKLDKFVHSMTEELEKIKEYAEKNGL